MQHSYMCTCSNHRVTHMRSSHTSALSNPPQMVEPAVFFSHHQVMWHLYMCICANHTVWGTYAVLSLFSSFQPPQIEPCDTLAFIHAHICKTYGGVWSSYEVALFSSVKPASGWAMRYFGIHTCAYMQIIWGCVERIWGKHSSTVYNPPQIEPCDILAFIHVHISKSYGGTFEVLALFSCLQSPSDWTMRYFGRFGRVLT